MKKGLALSERSESKGFTLVEMLVVIAVLSLFGILILTIFTRTLKGGNKAQIIGTMKQNGQAVLEQMDKTVRNSDNVVCPTPTDTCVTNPLTSPPCITLMMVKDGIYTRYRFIPPSASPKANGLIQRDNPSKQPIAETNPPREETDTEFVNRVCTVNNQMSDPIILTDTNLQTGVSVENGSFSRDRSAGFRDQVTIKFDVAPAVEASQAIRGQIDAIRFQTTVQLR